MFGSPIVFAILAADVLVDCDGADIITDAAVRFLRFVWNTK